MRRIALATLFLLLFPQHGFANCEGDTCIDVSANQESNEVVITVKKGKPGGVKSSKSNSSSTSAGTSVPKPRKPWIPWLPKPVTATAPISKATTKPSARPIARPKVKRIAGSQISNQVKRLLPTGSIITQPLADPLLQEPVNFMTNSPLHFTTVIIVLDVPITIHLTPTFTWSFGDGGSYTTKLPGAPYPLSIVEHTYRSPGAKQVTLTTIWSGYWRAGAITAPINGAITQRVEKQIYVRPAAINYRS